MICLSTTGRRNYRMQFLVAPYQFTPAPQKCKTLLGGEIPQIKYATDMDIALNSVKNILSKEYKTSNLQGNRSQILYEHNLYNLLERIISEN